LPIAEFDGRVDQRRAGALLLAFTQSEGWLPPYFSHDGDANSTRYELA
jgi:hypothetical protein